jgi:hypothetical protein
MPLSLGETSRLPYHVNFVLQRHFNAMPYCDRDWLHVREEVRASGGAGLLYDSLRRRTGSNVVAHRPRNVTDIVQTDHFEITVLATSRMIDGRKLSV